MPFYSFKPNPKQRVIDKAKNLFGRGSKVNVTGFRSASGANHNGVVIPRGAYVVECFLNDKSIAIAHSKNWRKAYGLLVIEVEKVFEDLLHKA